MKREFINIIYSTSIIINILLIGSGMIMFEQKGGIHYFKSKIYPEKKAGVPKYGCYYYNKTSGFEIMPSDSGEIIFLGNSIIDYCDWNELFSNPKIINRGIGSDCSSGILKRLDQITSRKPAKIFFTIDSKDLILGKPVDTIVNNCNLIIEKLNHNTPETSIYILSILPVDIIKAKNSEIISINKQLKSIAKKNNCIYIDLFDVFRNEYYRMDSCYSKDGEHLNGDGYRLIRTKIEQYVNN